MRVTSLDERWILVSEETFNDIRFGVGLTVDHMTDAIHVSPDTIALDERIHEHLNDGGIVVIHCG
jgi:hypothetical protein